VFLQKCKISDKDAIHLLTVCILVVALEQLFYDKLIKEIPNKYFKKILQIS